MKKIICVLLVFIVLFSVSVNATVNHNDSENHVYLTLPDGWEKHEGEGFCVFLSSDNSAAIEYTAKDLWSEELDDSIVLNRSSITNDVMDIDVIRENMEAGEFEVKDIIIETFGEREYYSAEPKEDSLLKKTVIRVENSYMYIYRFFGDLDSECYEDFEYMLENAVYFGPEAEETHTIWESIGVYILWLLVDVVLTTMIYMLPVIIYRYAIRRRPVKKSIAVIIALIYGMGIFLLIASLMFELIGETPSLRGCIVWSFLNYIILSKGKKKPKGNTKKETPCEGDSPDSNLL